MILYHKRQRFEKGGILFGIQSIPKDMKELIQPYVTSESKYNPKSKTVTGLRKPEEMNSSAEGLGFGADKDGFFVNTHRARCKSSKDPLKITQKQIDFINSTS